MYNLILPGQESFNESTGEFVQGEDKIYPIEHSLVSLSKWESKYEKPFLSKEEKTPEEVVDYIIMMSDNKLTVEDLNTLPSESIDDLMKYLESKQTATWFSKQDDKPSREIITAELIYFWMISFNIPVEFENWHINRLMTLIRVCSEKNAPPKKRSKADIMARNRELNRQRRAKMNTEG